MSNTFYTQYVSMQYFVFMINKKLTIHLNVKEWARIYLEGMSD